MTSQIASYDGAVSERAGKYLTFGIGREEYGLEILKVREIIGLMDITPVPLTPDSIRGVINLRGRIIPVLHLRVKFAMEIIEETNETCIIVVDSRVGDTTTQMGILVDRVCAVLDISAEEIGPPPAFGERADSEFILGIAKCKDEVKILLNTEQILNISELQAMDKTADPAG